MASYASDALLKSITHPTVGAPCIVVHLQSHIARCCTAHMELSGLPVLTGALQMTPHGEFLHCTGQHYNARLMSYHVEGTLHRWRGRCCTATRSTSSTATSSRRICCWACAASSRLQTSAGPCTRPTAAGGLSTFSCDSHSQSSLPGTKSFHRCEYCHNKKHTCATCLSCSARSACQAQGVCRE